MSARNGDKSRFHIARKKKIARRTRTQKLLDHGSTPTKTTEAGRVKPRSVAQ